MALVQLKINYYHKIRILELGVNPIHHKQIKIICLEWVADVANVLL